MDVPDDQPLPAGTLLAGKYEIRRRLGSGGMGAVYEARHVRMNKRVAVKVIRLGQRRQRLWQSRCDRSERLPR